MTTDLVTLIIGQAPSLAGFVILSTYALRRLHRCEEARDTLSKEHADLRVRIARLEAAVNGSQPIGEST